MLRNYQVKLNIAKLMTELNQLKMDQKSEDTADTFENIG